MAGVQNIKEVFLFIADLGNAIGTSVVDGWQVTDVANFIPAFTSLIPAITGVDQLDEEFLDMDSAEAQELFEALTGRFNIPQENYEEFFEDTIQLGLSLFGYVNKYFLSKQVPLER